jgi:ribonuclease R
VTTVLGDPLAPRAFSLIAIHKHGIPFAFSERPSRKRSGRRPAAERGPSRGSAPSADRRHRPVDARDHDDAIWAEPDGEGGFARWSPSPTSASTSARVARWTGTRASGQSVYFPDRVVPMLPEVLSADVCSLKAGADRAAMACHMTIDAQGA